MRSDMSKVIVERPRPKTGTESYKVVRRSRKRKYDEDTDSPKKEGIRVPHIKERKNCKIFNEYLAPLYRFLNSKVGLSWNSTYSEIRDRISPNSTVQAHILQHVKIYVETNPLFVGGKLVSSRGYEYNDGDLFVDKQGILRSYKRKARSRRLKKGEKYYTLYKERGATIDRGKDISWYAYNLHVVEFEEFDRMPPGKSRTVLRDFVAGSRNEAMNVLNEFKNSSDWNLYDRKFFKKPA